MGLYSCCVAENFLDTMTFPKGLMLPKIKMLRFFSKEICTVMQPKHGIVVMNIAQGLKIYYPSIQQWNKHIQNVLKSGKRLLLYFFLSSRNLRVNVRGHSRVHSEIYRVWSAHFLTGFSLGQFADCHCSAFMTLHVIGAKYPAFMRAGSMSWMCSKIFTVFQIVSYCEWAWGGKGPGLITIVNQFDTLTKRTLNRRTSVSSAPGLHPQLGGFLTTQKYISLNYL